jgi:hypothetical protein
MKKIINEPNWENLFNASVRIATTNIDENDGQQMVVEMLEYGKRLYLERKKMTEHSDKIMYFGEKRPISDLL